MEGEPALVQLVEQDSARHICRRQEEAVAALLAAVRRRTDVMVPSENERQVPSQFKLQRLCPSSDPSLKTVRTTEP